MLRGKAPKAHDFPEWLEECCVICMEEWVEGDVVVWLPCMHHFHRRCALAWAMS